LIFPLKFHHHLARYRIDGRAAWALDIDHFQLAEKIIESIVPRRQQGHDFQQIADL
jgi:hypothetical protein